MYKIEDIFERCKNENVKPFEVRLPTEIIDKGVMFCDLDDFFCFINLIKVNHIYVTQVIAEPEDFMISEQTIRSVLGRFSKNDILECISSNINEYNNCIYNLQLDYPVKIIVACVYEGQMYFTYVENEITLDGEELLEPEDVLEYIVAENEDKILKAKDKRQKHIEEQQEKLKEYILNDIKFYLSTNKDLRRTYIQDIFKKKMGKGYKELKELWDTSYGLPNRGAIEFIEVLWKEYGKNKKGVYGVK